MPRIRSIKPEFFDSPGTQKASHLARLLFIAMWCWADDWGIGDANPRRLLGFAFPHDDDERVIPRNFPGIAGEVAECYGVVWYEAEGREWFAIPSWELHQRTDKRSAKRQPTPDQAKRFLYSSSTETPRNPTESPGDLRTGTGEQGNRGTGEQVPAATPPAKRKRHDYPDDFEEFWQAFPVEGRKDKPKALASWKKAIDLASPTDIIAGAKRYAADPSRDPKYTKWAQGWLSGERWTDAAPTPAKRTLSVDELMNR